jgi:hypothetical protein
MKNAEVVTSGSSARRTVHSKQGNLDGVGEGRAPRNAVIDLRSGL